MNLEYFFKEVLKIKDQELCRELCAISQIKEIKKDAVLVREGIMQQYIILVLDGVYRGYYFTEDGSEVTDCFGFRAGDAAMACMNFSSPTIINISAVTDGRCVYIPVDQVVQLMQKYAELVQIYNQVLIESMQSHHETESILRNEATERYLWFLEKYEGLIDIVQHKDIASFLDMTPVTLSRVRRKLKE